MNIVSEKKTTGTQPFLWMRMVESVLFRIIYCLVMKNSSYGILAFVILLASTPTLALADSDGDQGSYQAQQQQSSPAPVSTQTEHQESGTGHNVISAYSNLVLYGTISAILWVVGYSAWKVYKVRRKVASRNLV